MDLGIKALQHIGIPTTDIGASESFYVSLGFEKVMDAGFDHPEGTGTCIMMQLHTILIEIYQFPGAASAQIKDRQDGHIDHIAFDVENIEETYQTLKNNGYSLVEPAPVFLQFWDKGCRYFNIIGPNNERLEFNQRL